MIGLLLATVALMLISQWLLTIIFLEFPLSIFHALDWLFSWIHIFDQVGYWFLIAILIGLLSWFLGD
ncbi:hypothetical protein [Gloeothece verrucosa]|uniref:Uncharacterized protein n=1 Tax=Gloeothece verrucosa (strain PCC 7822) TaxID=497965 RepID=E0UJD6_GLOV7|nr:hypothetical protein [Gloeothece verrucosa]ADN16954.1 hypothetical protein Cyan7822_5067 [Gloeothece verrucosa PCC 7822]